jgi:hypothetical protein
VFKRYGRREVLAGVSLSIEPGKTVGVATVFNHWDQAFVLPKQNPYQYWNSEQQGSNDGSMASYSRTEDLSLRRSLQIERLLKSNANVAVVYARTDVMPAPNLIRASGAIEDGERVRVQRLEWGEP